MAKRRSAAAFDVLNRRDIVAFLEGWADNATLVYPGDVDASGVRTGKEAIRAWRQRQSEQFPAARITVRHVAVSSIFLHDRRQPDRRSPGGRSDES
jgi:ketosteroid isomerase-like protein